MSGNSEAGPLIGIPGYRYKAKDLSGWFDSYAELNLEVYFEDYAVAVMQAGGLPVMLPREIDPARIVDRLDGLLLPGGPDVDPARYGQDRHDEVMVDETRDVFEFKLFEAAQAAGKPILGICRGLQVINVALGGTLHQHLPAHAKFEQNPADHAHGVRLEPTSTIGGLFGDGLTDNELPVNSLHHQAVDQLGDGLQAVGWASDDDVIEAIENADERIVAVQWHAEKLPTMAKDPLFSWIVTESAG